MRYRDHGKNPLRVTDTKNADRAALGEAAVTAFAKAAGRSGDLPGEPETVLVDLLADLMHWCDGRKDARRDAVPVNFGSALELARRHYGEECAGERQR